MWPPNRIGDRVGRRRVKPNFRTTFEKMEPEQGDSDLAVV
jgi:hypothetical protein